MLYGNQRYPTWLKLALVATALGTAIPTHAGTVSFAFVNADVSNALGVDLYNSSVALGPANSDVAGSWTCNTSCTGDVFSASGAGQANNGILGATATLSVPSTPAAGPYAFAYTNAEFIDLLTITGGSGPGVLVLRFTVDGSITTTQPGAGTVGTVATLSMCLVDGCNDSGVYSSLNSGAATQTTEQGFQSNATVTFYVPFTYGTQLEIEPFLSAQDQFLGGSPYLDGTPFTTTANFNSTVTLTSASVFTGTPTSLGTQVSNASIGSGDGFTYGPSGLSSTVPEPATWLLVASALGTLVFLNRRRDSGSARP